MDKSLVFLALNISATIISMIVIWLFLDIRAKKIVERQGKRRLIDRNFAKRILPLSKINEKKLEEKFKQANMVQDIYDVLARTILTSVMSGVAIFLLSLVFLPAYVGILLTVIVIGFALYQPFAEINGKIKSVQTQRAIELPHFIKTVITLLITQTSYDAIKIATDLAMPSIKPHAQKLLTEIGQYPNSPVPYDNFAKALNLKQARQFMNLLYQSLDLSQKNSLEFLEKLRDMSDSMEKQAAKKMSLSQQSSMRKYNRILFACLIVLPLSLMGVVFYDAFSKMM